MPSSPPAHSPARAPRSSRALAFFAVLAVLAGAVASACSLPGRPERILPEIQGTVRGLDAKGRVGESADGSRGRLTLVVIHSLTPSVHDRREVALATDHRFHFDPLLLDVAGQEFGRRYRIYLHFALGGSDRVIWRAQVSRLEDAAPIRLDCDLARPIALGEPCRVVEPLAQPWLLDEGKRHFRRLCADCHGKDARGGAAPRERPSSTDSPPDAAIGDAPDLTRLASRHGGRFDRDAVAAWIEGRSLSQGHTRGGMPVWGERLSSDFERYADGYELIGATLDPIVAYLESLQRHD